MRPERSYTSQSKGTFVISLSTLFRVLLSHCPLRFQRRKKCSPITRGVQQLEERTVPSLAFTAAGVLDVSPALFVENQGQWQDESVRYAAFGRSANVLHTDHGPVFQLFQQEPAEDNETSEDSIESGGSSRERQDVAVHQACFSATFDGANATEPTGLDQTETVHNYYIGEQAHWRTGVSSYQTVAYLDVYEGIDLFTWSKGNGLKYEFHVEPGANPSQIQVSYEGINGLWLDSDGALHIQTEVGEVTDDAPYIYQEIDGERVEVAGQFVLVDADTYSFRLRGNYDANAELVIDPIMMWSTYLGGTLIDNGHDVIADASGNLLLTGYTRSTNWVSGPDTALGGQSDAFVAKVSPAGALLWSTYVGGDYTDGGYGITVESSGNPIITGERNNDAFVTKLSSSGAHVWTELLGTGAGTDYGTDIALDSSGNLLVTGYTSSSGWVSGGFDTVLSGTNDAFVAKLSPTGTHLWSTYVGGTSSDSGSGIAVDGSGDVMVTGATSSSGWTVGGYDTSYGGNVDAFVAKLSSTGGHLWSTYLGGLLGDRCYSVVADGSGNPVVTGETGSSGWASGGYDTSYNGGSFDAFVAKLSGTGGFLWSTYLGGFGNDFGYGIAVDGSGNPVVTGETHSSGWTSEAFNISYTGGACDAFVVKLSETGGHQWSTYLGGAGDDLGNCITVDSSGNLIITGVTGSSGWISGGFDTSYNGGDSDAFLVRISEPGPDKVGVRRDRMSYLDVDGSSIWSTPEDVFFGFGIAGDEVAVGDWNGDGSDEVGVYRSSTSMWYLDADGDRTWNVSDDVFFAFGIAGDEPVIGDWDGNGVDDVGVYRPTTGKWYLDADGSYSWNSPGDAFFAFGVIGDTPLTGDWNGDGIDEVGVYRPSTGMWYLDYDGNHQWNVPGDVYFRFGITADEPIVGDWNNDGVDEVGVHRGNWWYLDYDGNGAWDLPEDEYFRFGLPGDQPVVGRWQSGAGQASFAFASSVLLAGPETALMVEMLPTSDSTATNATRVDSVFAAELVALPSISESETELPMDAISDQVTRSNRLGSGGLLDLPTANVHDQVLEELQQSIWWL